MTLFSHEELKTLFARAKKTNGLSAYADEYLLEAYILVMDMHTEGWGNEAARASDVVPVLKAEILRQMGKK